MKKWLYPALIFAAIGTLSRLPHPAGDLSKLDPVRAVYLYMDRGMLFIETDTGDSGSGLTLAQAAASMQAQADREIFLETAQFLILDPDVPITEDIYHIFRPGCAVLYTETAPDLKTVSDYLDIHRPKTTLAHLRAA